MFTVVLQWKEHSLNLGAISTWMRVNAGEHYVGNSADYALTLWFTEEPTPEILDYIQTYWDGLDEASSEATSYKSTSQIRDRMEELKADIPAKTWNQLNMAQRKIVVGVELTDDDLWA